jgi:hypothetical protein
VQPTSLWIEVAARSGFQSHIHEIGREKLLPEELDNGIQREAEAVFSKARHYLWLWTQKFTFDRTAAGRNIKSRADLGPRAKGLSCS